MLNVNQLIGFGAGDNAPPVDRLTYLGTVETPAGLSTRTIADFALGPAAADRVIVVVGTDQIGSSITSVSVGGVALTKHPTTGMLYYGVVPSGVTGDIVFTGVATGYILPISVYALNGLASTTPIVTPADTSFVNPNVLTFTGLPEGGVVVAIVYSGSANASNFGGTLEPNVDNNFGPNRVVAMSVASAPVANGTIQTTIPSGFRTGTGAGWN